MAPRIAIIGTGLVGTSIGLGLKKARLGYEIVGHDKEASASGKAKQRGAIDKSDWNLISAIDGAGLVILALPLAAIKPTMEAMAPHLGEGAVVTDTASVKQAVLEWARTILPPTVSFVGGHPLISKETIGHDAAAAELLAGCTYCLIPGAGAKSEAVELLVGLAATLGAEPFFPDPVEHDNFQAAVVHLPLLMAAALVNAAASGAASREMRKMTGAAFRQATSLAAGDPAASALICSANRDAILRWTDAYLSELGRLRDLVANGADLQPEYERTAGARERWLLRDKDERSDGYESPMDTAGSQMKHFFLGDLGAKRRK